MRFRIRHTTRYTYSAPVELGPHVLRLRPRADGVQRVESFALAIDPPPALVSTCSDAAGNTVTHAWFAGRTPALSIVSDAVVETSRDNPFDYRPDPDGAGLPQQYPDAELALLEPYRRRVAADPAVDAFALDVAARAGADAAAFGTALNLALFNGFRAEIRDGGDAQAPADTLAWRQGACRDLTVLFLDASRAQGLAARFVSGYRRGDLSRQERYLHAWPELYVPGGGWRGWDPVEGLAVADTHVALAAGPAQRDTMPVDGSFVGWGVGATLDYAVEIAADG